MKFMQMHPFYPQYLNQFYSDRPELHLSSYDDQIAAIIADGFGASHIFAAYLGKVGYETFFSIPNCVQLQARWMVEQNPSCKEIINWEQTVLLAQIESFKPDILYIGDPISYDSSFIRALKHRPTLVIGWRAAVIPAGTDFSEFDIILSSSVTCREKALQHGAQAVEHLLPGIPGAIAAAAGTVREQFDLVFCGSWTAEHAQRNDYLASIANAPPFLTKTRDLAYFLAGNAAPMPPSVAAVNYGPRWGMEMYRVLKSGRINFNSSIDLAEKELTNMRMFEIASVGSFQIVEGHSTLARYFQPGVELETFQNQGELFEKIGYYLDRPEERRVIAEAGRIRCLRDHSMEQRINEFDAIIRHYAVQKKTSAPRPGPADLHDSGSRQVGENETAMERFAQIQEQKTQQLQAARNSIAAPLLAPPVPGPDDLEGSFPGVSFGALVQVLGIRNMAIGTGTCIGDSSWLNVCVRDEHVRMRIGNSVLVGRQGFLSTGGYLEIGDYCVFAPRVYISDADHIYTDITQPILQQGATLNRSVIIEENCWLGINTVISGNLTVGRGSVIGANTVVIRDIPPFSVVVGNPAQIVKMYSPLSETWERVHNKDDIARVLRERQEIGMQSREKYLQTLKKNACFSKLDPVLTGRGNLI